MYSGYFFILDKIIIPVTDLVNHVAFKVIACVKSMIIHVSSYLNLNL